MYYEPSSVLEMLDALFEMAKQHKNGVVSANKLIHQYPSIHHFTPRLEDMKVLARNKSRRVWADFSREPDEAMAQELIHRVNEYTRTRREGHPSALAENQRARKKPMNKQIMEALMRIEKKLESGVAEVALPRELERDLTQLDVEINHLTRAG